MVAKETQLERVFDVDVWVTLKFEGFHRWKDAPSDVSFLRFWHRHMFGVMAAVEVTHNDRQVEFFQLKRKLWERVTDKWEGQQFEASCEMIATDLLAFLTEEGYVVSCVTVDEDGENGATLSVKGLTDVDVA